MLLVACASRETRPPPPPEPPAHVTLFISTEVKGYLAPCGCSEAMRGGLSRSALVIENARKEGQPVHFIAAGDGVFGAAEIPEEARGQQKLKAQTLAAAWKAMGLDVATWKLRKIHAQHGNAPDFDPFEHATAPAYNPFQDLLSYAKLVRTKKRMGIFTIGGGGPRNWAQQGAPG